MSRLEEIRERATFRKYIPVAHREDIEWLLAEVDRLRSVIDQRNDDIQKLKELYRRAAEALK